MELHFYLKNKTHNKTPLHFACNESNLQIIELLLENGADIDATDDYILYFYILLDSDDESSLFYSCKNKEPKIFKYFIDKSSNNEYESNRKLLFEVCSKENYFKIVDYLLSKGVNPEVERDEIFVKLIY